MGSGGALALDVVCAVAPIAAGGGLLLRAATHVDDVGDALKVADGADGLFDLAKRIGSAGENADPPAIEWMIKRGLISQSSQCFNYFVYRFKGACVGS
jgi:hypothetical protein